MHGQVRINLGQVRWSRSKEERDSRNVLSYRYINHQERWQSSRHIPQTTNPNARSRTTSRTTGLTSTPSLNRRSKLSSNAKQNNFKIRRFLRAHRFKNTKISPPPRGKEKKCTNHSRYGSINRRSSQILQQQSRIRSWGGTYEDLVKGDLRLEVDVIPRRRWHPSLWSQEWSRQ